MKKDSEFEIGGVVDDGTDGTILVSSALMMKQALEAAGAEQRGCVYKSC